MSKLKIGVLISGSGTNLQALIDYIEKEKINAEISVVISNRKKAYGLQRAADNNIPNYFLSKKELGSMEKFDAEIIRLLKKHQVKLVVLAGYLLILTPKFIDEYTYRIINIHPALIPSFCGEGYYGLKVHEAAVNYGVKISGATVHFVDTGTDTGPVILQDTVKVNHNDTPENLQKKVLKIEHKLLPLSVKLFCENKIEVIERPNKKPLVKIKSN